MSVYTILLSGDLKYSERLQNQTKDTVVIAADAGIKHAKLFNLTPSIWIGDFDSYNEKQQEDINDKEYANIEIFRYPVDKDKTDGELAIDEAIKRGAKSIILCGAFGGDRIDHSLAHIAMALSLAQRGIDVTLTSGDCESIALVAEDRTITKTFNWGEKKSFSLVNFSDIIGLNIAGAKWNLAGEQIIKAGSTHTLSNVSMCDKVVISLTSGRVLVTVMGLI